MGAGRPNTFNQDIADLICIQISTSNKSLKHICDEDEYLPEVSTVYRWLRTNEDFSKQYARAKEEQADYLVEEMLGIADDITNDTIEGEDGRPLENKEWVNRSKLRIDTRKWIASKLKAKKYGDKLDVTTDGEKLKGFEIIIDGNSPDTDNEA